MWCRVHATPVGVIRAAGRAAKDHTSQQHKRLEFNADSIGLYEGSLDARTINICFVWLKNQHKARTKEELMTGPSFWI